MQLSIDRLPGQHSHSRIEGWKGKFHPKNIPALAERFLHTSRWSPENFWKTITDTVCDRTLGTGNAADRTGRMDSMVEFAINYLGDAHDRKNSRQLADFIMVGQRAILEHYQNNADNETIADTLASFYSQLVDSQALGEGWETSP